MSDFWKFEKDAAVVEGVRYPFTELPKEREIQGAGRDLFEAAEAWRALSRAKASFETGGAVYRDCLANILNLNTGMRDCQRALNLVYAGIATFIDGPKSPFMALSEELRLEFAGELLGHLSRLVKAPPADPPPPVEVPV